PDDSELLGLLIKDFRELCKTSPELKEMDLNQQIDFLLDHGGSQTPVVGISKEQARRVTKIHFKSARAIKDYAPPRYPGRITIFRAVEAGPESHYAMRHPALGNPEIITGWSGLTSEPLEVFDVPGDHITMMTEPHVRVMAEYLNACLDRE